MTISINTVVKVNITMTPSTASSANFGTMNIIYKGVLDGNRLTYYTGTEEMGDLPEHVVAAATTYFSQKPRPSTVAIGVWSDEETEEVPATAAVYTGVQVDTTLGNWTAITDGSIKLNVDGDEQDITGLDFSGAGTMNAAVQILTDAIEATFSGTVTDFSSDIITLTSPTTGASSSFDFAIDAASGTSILTLTGLAEVDGASIVNGEDVIPEVPAETVTEALTAMVNQSDDWYGVSFADRDVPPEELYEAALWTEAQEFKMAGFCFDDPDCIDEGVDDDPINTLGDMQYRKSIAIYDVNAATQYPEISALARQFTVDYSATNSAITMKFKQLPGVLPTPLSEGGRLALINKNGNAYYNVGNQPMFAEGVVCSGAFIDEVHGVDWLKDDIQKEVFNLLYTKPTKVPYTNAGMAMIEQKVTASLERAVRNGLVAPGYTSEGEYLPLGYKVIAEKVENASAADKGDRIAPPITFTALGAGAIHSIEISGYFER